MLSYKKPKSKSSRGAASRKNNKTRDTTARRASARRATARRAAFKNILNEKVTYTINPTKKEAKRFSNALDRIVENIDPQNVSSSLKDALMRETRKKALVVPNSDRFRQGLLDRIGAAMNRAKARGGSSDNKGVYAATIGDYLQECFKDVEECEDEDGLNVKSVARKQLALTGATLLVMGAVYGILTGVTGISMTSIGTMSHFMISASSGVAAKKIQKIRKDAQKSVEDAILKSK